MSKQGMPALVNCVFSLFFLNQPAYRLSLSLIFSENQHLVSVILSIDFLFSTSLISALILFFLSFHFNSSQLKYSVILVSDVQDNDSTLPYSILCSSQMHSLIPITHFTHPSTHLSLVTVSSLQLRVSFLLCLSLSASLCSFVS